MEHKKIFLITFILVIFFNNANANFVTDWLRGRKALFDSTQTPENDSLKRKNLKITLIGGPGYSPDYGFLIGGGALFSFKTDKDNHLLKESSVPMSLRVVFKGGIGINLRVSPKLFFKDDKIRVNGLFDIIDNTSYFYGIGAENASNTTPLEGFNSYTNQQFIIKPEVKFRILDTDFFVGPRATFAYKLMANITPGVLAHPDYINYGGDEDGYSATSAGVGVTISYDSRDLPANAYRGLLLEAVSENFFRFLGSSSDYHILSFEYRQYALVGLRKVLAWNLKATRASEDTPITDLPTVGSASDLRGYYIGKYRDKKVFHALLEYRQMLNFNEKTTLGWIMSRFGFVVWGGMGLTYTDDIKKIAGLPNYGVGLRFELSPRMNFRFDIGTNHRNDETLMYFNSTEAF